MTIDGDVLEIDIDMELDDVVALKEFVKDRLKYIEEISVLGEGDNFKTSSLFQLLFSIKKVNPSIKIPLIDEPEFAMKIFGNHYWIR